MKVIENAVGERQVQRLKRRFQPGSLDWVSMATAGRAMPWQLAPDLPQRVLELARGKYAEFNDSHVHES
ncbi:MAG: hypothetical protein ABI383_02285 [Acidobacteriaceae bacterium]